jgi:hypothetical protein
MTCAVACCMLCLLAVMLLPSAISGYGTFPLLTYLVSGACPCATTVGLSRYTQTG